MVRYGDCSSDNPRKLATGPGGATLWYDPTGRLSRLTKGAVTKKYEYLGPRLVIERDAAASPTAMSMAWREALLPRKPSPTPMTPKRGKGRNIAQHGCKPFPPCSLGWRSIKALI
ncbi:hypothetical protein [Sphingopyxis terrae]|uniref:hypothetical protein n=1 Tax=Sphingopyxis terrae TaxID=33052 RepID=UPI001054EC28|nr:hypothetical protein [Sphingopyxis terrae]